MWESVCERLLKPEAQVTSSRDAKGMEDETLGAPIFKKRLKTYSACVFALHLLSCSWDALFLSDFAQYSVRRTHGIWSVSIGSWILFSIPDLNSERETMKEMKEWSWKPRTFQAKGISLDLNPIRTETYSLDLAIRRLIMTLMRAVSVAQQGRDQIRLRQESEVGFS